MEEETMFFKLYTKAMTSSTIHCVIIFPYTNTVALNQVDFHVKKMPIFKIKEKTKDFFVSKNHIQNQVKKWKYFLG